LADARKINCPVNCSGGLFLRFNDSVLMTFGFLV
jgi:hypothetical protein